VLLRTTILTEHSFVANWGEGGVEKSGETGGKGHHRRKKKKKDAWNEKKGHEKDWTEKTTQDTRIETQGDTTVGERDLRQMR